MEGWEREDETTSGKPEPGPASRGAAGGGAAEAEKGAARGGAARSGYSRRAVQTEGGKGGGPTRTWRGGCHSPASLGARRWLLPGAPSGGCLSPLPPGPAAGSVRARLGLQVGGSGGPRCVPASGPPGVPGSGAHFAFQVLGLERRPEADLLPARSAPGDAHLPSAFRWRSGPWALAAERRRPPFPPPAWPWEGPGATVGAKRRPGETVNHQLGGVNDSAAAYTAFSET